MPQMERTSGTGTDNTNTVSHNVLRSVYSKDVHSFSENTESLRAKKDTSKISGERKAKNEKEYQDLARNISGADQLAADFLASMKKRKDDEQAAQSWSVTRYFF